jgi:hypothetical protein
MPTAPHSREKHLPSSAASGRETGWENLLQFGVMQYTTCPAHAVTLLQLGCCLTYNMIHRVGAVAQQHYL